MRPPARASDPPQSQRLAAARRALPPALTRSGSPLHSRCVARVTGFSEGIMLSHFRSAGRIRSTHGPLVAAALLAAVLPAAAQSPPPPVDAPVPVAATPAGHACAGGGGDTRCAGVLPRHRVRRARRCALQLVLEPPGRRRAIPQLRYAARSVPRRDGAGLDRQSADRRLAGRLQGEAERRPREHDRAEPRAGGVVGAAGHRRGLHQLSRAGRQGPAGRRG